MARACVRRYSSWRWRPPPRRLRLLKLSLSSRLPFTHRASGDAGSSFVRSSVRSRRSSSPVRSVGTTASSVSDDVPSFGGVVVGVCARDDVPFF